MMTYFSILVFSLFCAWIGGHVLAKVYLSGVEKGLKELDGRMDISITLTDKDTKFSDNSGNVVNLKDYRGKTIDRHA